MPTYISSEYPLILCGEPVIEIEVDNELLNVLNTHCSSIKDRWENDIFPYWACWEVLRAVGKTERMAVLCSDKAFKDQLREMLPEMPNNRINILRRYIAGRVVAEMPQEGEERLLFLFNLWYCDDIYTYKSVPSEIQLGSAEHQMYLNLLHLTHDQKNELRDAIRMCDNDHLADYKPRLERATSYTTVKEIHDIVSEEYTRITHLEQQEKLVKPFPEQPWELPAGVTWLHDGNAVVAEGVKMHHCVASYVDSALIGNIYLYHIEDPAGGVATLELDRRGSVKQFRGKHNHDPSEACKNIVSSWVRPIPTQNQIQN